MKNILIVEDESLVAMEIAAYVNKLGYRACETVSSAKSALDVVSKKNVDLVLMDVYIKGDVDGIACAREIKKMKNIPVIYISAFSDDQTLERAIETNPSTYLVKPFSRDDLKIAIKIALKHSEIEDQTAQILVGDIVFDEEFSYDTYSDELLCLGESIRLTKQERILLKLLIDAKNSVVSIYELENEIWPQKESNENTRRALVARLRAKLNYKFIETVHSVGYKIHF